MKIEELERVAAVAVRLMQRRRFRGAKASVIMRREGDGGVRLSFWSDGVTAEAARALRKAGLEVEAKVRELVVRAPA
jgi:hypothetical protein